MQSLLCISFFSFFIFNLQIYAQEPLWVPLPGLGTVPTTTANPISPVDELNDQFRKSHNQYRAIHGAPALAFNATLQEQAKQCADGYADNIYTVDKPCKTTGDYYREWQPTTVEPTLPGLGFLAQDLAGFWYTESDLLDFMDLRYIPTTYHVRQMLWKATSQIGCATSKATAQQHVFVLCVYSPVGNVETLVGSDTPPMTFPTDNLILNVLPASALK